MKVKILFLIIIIFLVLILKKNDENFKNVNDIEKKSNKNVVRIIFLGMGFIFLVISTIYLIYYIVHGRKYDKDDDRFYILNRLSIIF